MRPSRTYSAVNWLWGSEEEQRYHHIPQWNSIRSAEQFGSGLPFNNEGLVAVIPLSLNQVSRDLLIRCKAQLHPGA